MLLGKSDKVAILLVLFIWEIREKGLKAAIGRGKWEILTNCDVDS